MAKYVKLFSDFVSTVKKKGTKNILYDTKMQINMIKCYKTAHIILYT